MPKPWVRIACFCDSIREDPDGTISLIRLIDQIVLIPKAPGAPVTVPINAFVAIDGIRPGQDVQLRIDTPRGKPAAAFRFKAEATRQNFKLMDLTMEMATTVTGDLSLNISVDGQPLGRVLLMISVLGPPTGPPA